MPPRETATPNVAAAGSEGDDTQPASTRDPEGDNAVPPTSLPAPQMRSSRPRLNRQQRAERRLHKALGCLEGFLRQHRAEPAATPGEDAPRLEGIVIVSHIVTPLLFAAAFYLGLAGIAWGGDYALEQHCPVTQRFRDAARSDSLVYYQVKPSLSSLCDTEDSVWRFFTDFWVRSVLTGTDSWYILMLQFKAVSIGTAFAMILTPAFALPCAAACCVVRAVEEMVPTNRVTLAIEHAILLLSHAVSAPFQILMLLSRSSLLGLVLRGVRGTFLNNTNSTAVQIMRDLRCLVTLSVPRRRLRVASADLARYHAASQALLQDMLLTAVSSVLLLRFFFIWLELAPALYDTAVSLDLAGFDILGIAALLTSQRASVSSAVRQDIGIARLLDGISGVVFPKHISPPFVVFIGFVTCFCVDLMSIYSSFADGTNAERKLRALLGEAQGLLHSDTLRRAARKRRWEAKRSARNAELTRILQSLQAGGTPPADGLHPSSGAAAQGTPPPQGCFVEGDLPQMQPGFGNSLAEQLQQRSGESGGGAAAGSGAGGEFGGGWVAGAENQFSGNADGRSEGGDSTPSVSADEDWEDLSDDVRRKWG